MIIKDKNIVKCIQYSVGYIYIHWMYMKRNIQIMRNFFFNRNGDKLTRMRWILFWKDKLITIKKKNPKKTLVTDITKD